jgi:nuclear transport factor 2 (NTF2) superfamily protein
MSCELRYACSMTPEELLRTMYDGFNARDIDAVLAAMTEDVDWPNAWEGSRVHGHQEVRDYWTRQWASIDPRVTPLGFETLADGRIAVEVQQVIRDLDGEIQASGAVSHVYEIRDGLVSRMDVEEA